MFDTGERLTDDILTAAGVDVGEFRSTLKTLISAMDPAGLRTGGLAACRPRPPPIVRQFGTVTPDREQRTASRPSWPARPLPGDC